MQRVSGVLLALLAIVVALGAGYVIVHNDDVPSGAAAPRGTSVVPTSTAPTSSSPAKAAPSVVAFLGDDWTSGAEASRTADRFTTRLAGALGVRERNFGVKGGGYAAGAGYDSQLDRLVAARPDVVVVSGGREDVVDVRLGEADQQKIDAAASSLFATLHRRLPKAKLIAIRPMWGDSAAPIELDALAKAVRTAVRRAGGTYLDVDDPIEGHPGDMASSSDPNDKGYAAIAGALTPELSPLLRS